MQIDPEPREGFTVEDFLMSKTWCYKMKEIAFKKADIDGDGFISEEDRKIRVAFDELCSGAEY